MTMAEMDVDQVRAMLVPLWAKNRDHILERLAHVRIALLADTEPSDDQRSDLHALVGTLGTYGWPAGSALMADIHRHLTSSDTTADRDSLIRQLDELTTTLAEV